MSMKWYIITSKVGTKIVPVQKYLFKKYAPDVRLNWIDLGGRHLENWCVNIYNHIIDDNPTKSVLLMLDDHLLIDRLTRIISMPDGLERLELGQRNRWHRDSTDDGDFYVRFTNTTKYKVSTQPSIWNTEALLRVLEQVNSNPWHFETKGVCTAGIVKEPVLHVIQESAISGRKKGKINLNGMKHEDVKELIDKGLINENDIVNSWK